MPANPIAKTPVARKSLLPVVQQQKTVVDGSDTDDLASRLFNFRVPGLPSGALVSPEWIAVSPLTEFPSDARKPTVSFTVAERPERIPSATVTNACESPPE
jgi:hypothetical protein